MKMRIRTEACCTGCHSMLLGIALAITMILSPMLLNTASADQNADCKAGCLSTAALLNTAYYNGFQIDSANLRAELNNGEITQDEYNDQWDDLYNAYIANLNLVNTLLQNCLNQCNITYPPGT